MLAAGTTATLPGDMLGSGGARLASGAAGSSPSNFAPSLIQVTSRCNSWGETLPPPRGMSPDSITSIRRLPVASPAMRTMPLAEPFSSAA